MKVAIIHYWLVGMRGGEKVIEALCEMYPQADIFTHVYVPEMVSDRIRQHRIIPTFINSLPRAARMYKTYLPLMPLALEQLDLRGYDLIISSESGPAKGIIPPSDALHVCYCHTPMRYIWNMYHDYRNSAGRVTRLMMPPLAHYLRMWDVTSAARVDSFVANSATVARRIHRYYGADSVVIHPPVDTGAFSIAAPSELDDYYLMAGELVSYKRPDLAVRAFNEMKLKLVVIGGGEMLEEIRRLAGPTVTVLGSQPFDVSEAALRAMPRVDLSGRGRFRDGAGRSNGERPSRGRLWPGRRDRNRLQWTCPAFSSPNKPWRPSRRRSKVSPISKSTPKRSQHMRANLAGTSSFKRCASTSMACWPKESSAH